MSGSIAGIHIKIMVTGLITSVQMKRIKSSSITAIYMSLICISAPYSKIKMTLRKLKLNSYITLTKYCISLPAKEDKLVDGNGFCEPVLVPVKS